MSETLHHSPVFDWKVALWVLPAVALGLWCGDATGLGLASIFSGTVAGLVALVGSRGDLRASTSLAASAGVLLLVLTMLSGAVANIPLAAAIAFAGVAFLTSVASSAPPVGLLFALLGSTFYLFATGFSLVLIKDQRVSLLTLATAALVGVVWGLIVVVMRGLYTNRTSRIVARAKPARAELWLTMGTALREFRRGPKDGVRRALAFAVATYWFELVPNHDSFLILLTIAVLLPVEGRVSVLTGSYRLFGAYLTVGVALSLTFVLPAVVIYGIAIGALIYAVAVAARSTTHSDAAIAVAFLLFIGAPGADIGIYAGWRLIEAAGGFVVALLAGYVLWPRQALTIVPIPDDLVAQSNKLSLWA
jgi:hypothetical protein